MWPGAAAITPHARARSRFLFFVRGQKHEGQMTQDHNFAAMSVDALWQLHEELRVVLAAKMAEQRHELDERLRDLEQFSTSSKRTATALRPKAGPVYRNPAQPSQIWSGRGLRPRWLVFQLAAGHALEEFRVEPDSLLSVVPDDDGSSQKSA
jgi:DNA-binding protein H-NS